MSQFFKSPVFVVLIFFLCLAAAIGASRIVHSDNADPKLGNTPLVVETIGKGNDYQISVGERYIGRVEAGQRADIGFDISSEVIAIYKSEGESFQKGELLAELDTQRLEAQKRELKAAESSAIAARKLAEASLKRSIELNARRNLSDQALDEAKQQKDAAVAEVERVRAQQKTVDVELRKSKLVAPFSGVIIDRLTDVGKTAVPGAPLLIIEQSGLPEIRVSLPLKTARTLSDQDRLLVNHQGDVFPAFVERINLALNSARVSEVFLSPQVDESELVSGEIVTVEMPSRDESEGFWLPISALTEFGRGLWSVYLAYPQSDNAQLATISRSVVELVQVRGEFAKVRGGITEADLQHVVKGSTHRIVAGQEVSVSQSQKIASGA